MVIEQTGSSIKYDSGKRTATTREWKILICFVHVRLNLQGRNWAVMQSFPSGHQWEDLKVLRQRLLDSQTLDWDHLLICYARRHPVRWWLTLNASVKQRKVHFISHLYTQPPILCNQLCCIGSWVVGGAYPRMMVTNSPILHSLGCWELT